MFDKKTLLRIGGKHALIAIVILIFSIITIVYLTNEIKKYSKIISDSRTATVAFEKRTESFAKLNKDIDIVNSNSEKIEAAFLSSDNILEYVSVLENTATKHSVPQTFRFETPLPADTIPAPFPLSQIGYQTSVTVDMNTFIKYLKDIEGLPYFSKIDSMTLSSQNLNGLTSGGVATFHTVLYSKTTE